MTILELFSGVEKAIRSLWHDRISSLRCQNIWKTVFKPNAKQELAKDKRSQSLLYSKNLFLLNQYLLKQKEQNKVLVHKNNDYEYVKNLTNTNSEVKFRNSATKANLQNGRFADPCYETNQKQLIKSFR